MHIAIIGAAGMVGRKLTQRLSNDGHLGETPVEKLTLIDIVAAEPPKGFAGSVDTLAADISTMETAQKIVSGRPDVIFHLAAIVSGEAELDFDKGYRINLMAPAICSMRSGVHTLLTAISLAWFSHRPLPFLVLRSPTRSLMNFTRPR